MMADDASRIATQCQLLNTVSSSNFLTRKHAALDVTQSARSLEFLAVAHLDKTGMCRCHVAAVTWLDDGGQ